MLELIEWFNYASIEDFILGCILGWFITRYIYEIIFDK